MPLKCTCPRCGKLHRNIDKGLLGKKFQCDCGKVMRLGGGTKNRSPKTAAPSKPAVAKPAAPKRNPSANPPPATPSAPPARQPAVAKPKPVTQTVPRPSPVSTTPPAAATAKSDRSPNRRDVVPIENSDEGLQVVDSKPAPSQKSGAKPKHEFDDVDDLIANVAEPLGSTSSRTKPQSPATVSSPSGVTKPVTPIPDPVDVELQEVEPEESFVVLEDSNASFEILGEDESEEVIDLAGEDESEEVIDLSDEDVVGGLPVATATSRPDRNPAAVAAPASAMPGPTATSMNPAYTVFGPPPPATYPAEPQIAGSYSAAPASYGGFQKSRSGTVSVLGIFAILVAFAGVVFSLWYSFSCYRVISYFMPGSAIGRQLMSNGGGTIAVIFGIGLLAGIGMLAGCCLFLVNEIYRIVSRTSPMAFASIVALVSSSFLLLVEFGRSCYAILNLSTYSLSVGANVGTNVVNVLIGLVLVSIVPAAVIAFSLLRER